MICDKNHLSSSLLLQNTLFQLQKSSYFYYGIRLFWTMFFFDIDIPTLDVVFRQIEIVLKDSTAFVYVTQSEKSSH